LKKYHLKTELSALCRKYLLTPAFRLGINKIAVFGFSHELILIINQIVRAKAQKLFEV
jgi:hypothetical protein